MVMVLGNRVIEISGMVMVLGNRIIEISGYGYGLG